MMVETILFGFAVFLVTAIVFSVIKQRTRMDFIGGALILFLLGLLVTLLGLLVLTYIV